MIAITTTASNNTAALPAIRPRGTTFLRQLQDSKVSPLNLIVQIGMGHVDPPTVLDSPCRRWMWFAELLSNREHGIATYLPGIADLCAAAADLCRQTTAPIDSDGLARQWDVLAMRIAESHQNRNNTGEHEALDMLADLAVDGADYCQAGEGSGFEALLGYILTIETVHGPAARETLRWAAEPDAALTSASDEVVPF